VRARGDRNARATPASKPESTATATAYGTGIGMLARRARGRAELTRKLLQKGFSAEQVEEAVTRLGSRGFLDDAELAASVSRSRLRSGHGRRKVAFELARRGVAVDDAVAGWQRAGGAEAESAALEETAARLWRSRAGQPRVDRIRRTTAALLRRGYAPGAVFATLRRLWPQDADEALDGVDTDSVIDENEGEQ
jgi:regulatory protein